jgi:NADH dehydrogenase (ubiquinone) Fe-S protein 6
MLTRFLNRQVRDWAVPELVRFHPPDFIMLGRRVVAQLASPLRRALSTSRTAGNDSPVVAEKPDLSAPKQAPNHPTTWTTSQRLRPGLGSSPSFEQTNMDLQPNPLSAMELISQEPVRVVNGRKAVCDGGACLAVFTPC